MRISDWSSDVCSSDLARRLARNRLSSSQTRPLRRVRTTRAISNQRIDVPLEPGFGIGSWEFGRSDLRVFRLSRQNHHGGGCCASPIPNPQSPLQLSCCNTARTSSCGISPRPTCFLRFLPSFFFSSPFFLRDTPPPYLLATPLFP